MAGDRVKTDRREAEKLARCYRSGDLTAVGFPTEVRGVAGPGTCPRSSQAGSDASAASIEQVPFVLRPASTNRRETMDASLSDLGRAVTLPQIAQEATRQDYLHEVEHMRERVARLEQAIIEAVKERRPHYNKSSMICRHCAVSQIFRL